MIVLIHMIMLIEWGCRFCGRYAAALPRGLVGATPGAKLMPARPGTPSTGTASTRIGCVSDVARGRWSLERGGVMVWPFLVGGYDGRGRRCRPERMAVIGLAAVIQVLSMAHASVSTRVRCGPRCQAARPAITSTYSSSYTARWGRGRGLRRACDSHRRARYRWATRRPSGGRVQQQSQGDALVGSGGLMRLANRAIW